MLKSQSFSSLLDEEDMMNLHGWSADCGLPALVREDTLSKGCELWRTSSA